MTARRLLFVLPPLALLAACTEAPSDDSRSASGEVLEGTISDAMLPVDTVQSEPPLADPEAARAVQDEAAADAAEEAGESEGEGVAGEEALADEPAETASEAE